MFRIVCRRRRRRHEMQGLKKQYIYCNVPTENNLFTNLAFLTFHREQNCVVSLFDF